MFAPLRRHWYVIGPVPVAVTLNVAGFGSMTARLTGWLVRSGGGGPVTVSVETKLVTDPLGLLTTTSNCVALSPAMEVGDRV